MRLPFAELKKDSKTMMGSKFQREFMDHFDLAVGGKLDANIEGLDVDVKFTSHKTWMIPPECLNQWALLARGDVDNQICSLELVFIDRIVLPSSRDNRDGKFSLPQARLEWLGEKRWIVPPTTFIFEDTVYD